MDMNSSKEELDRNTTGSIDKDEPVFLVVGRIRRAHGLKGEMVMDVLTDFPERIKKGRTVFTGETHTPHVIASVRSHDTLLLIRFEGIESKDDADRYHNVLVYKISQDLPQLPENEYYHHDLIGLSVIDQHHEVLGELVEIMETGANDVYVVLGKNENEILIPAVDEFILSIDLTEKTIQVKNPEWLE